MIIKRIKKSIKYIFEQNIPRRQVKVYNDDIFLVSYPRSGNTWLRFILGNVLFDTPTSFLNLESRIPDIYQNTARYLKKIERPRMLKSHEYYDPRYKKVIYLVRDPRDVVVSYYYYHLKNKWLSSSVSLSDFVDHFIVGAWTPQYGSWGENVNSWLGSIEFSNILLVRYEDLFLHGCTELSRITSYLGLEVDELSLKKALDLSSVREMRNLEDMQSDNWPTTKNTSQEIKFVRKAKIKEWKNKLSINDVEKIEMRWGKLMESLNYQKE